MVVVVCSPSAETRCVPDTATPTMNANKPTTSVLFKGSLPSRLLKVCVGMISFHNFPAVK